MRAVISRPQRYALWQRGRSSGGGGVAAPDYTYANQTEFNAIIALGSATLAGKRINSVGNVAEITLSGFTGNVLAPPIFGSNPGSSVQRFALTNVSNMLFDGLNYQMRGYPKNYTACVSFNGAISNVHHIRCNARHGYGAGLVNYDISADLPEYTRVDNVVTATTTSQAIALSYQDTAVNVPRDAWIEFFNRDPVNTVYFKTGAAGVTATTGDTACAPNSRVRIQWNTATTDRPTHIAVITAAGTAQINARTEIGLAVYLADFAESSTGTTLNNVSFRKGFITDFANVFKSPGAPAGIVWFDQNVIYRTYMDVHAVNDMPNTPGVELWITRNTIGMPGARAGIAENLQGDARDPHGDVLLQLYNGNNVALDKGRIRIAGNRYFPQVLRASVNSQGFFGAVISNTTPSYIDDVLVISNIMPYGSQNQLVIGRSPGSDLGSLVRTALIQANTVLGLDTVDGSSISVRQDTAGTFHTLMKDNAARVVGGGVDIYREGNVIWTAANLGASFKTPGDRLIGTLTPDQFVTAVETVQAGKGFNAALIDWTTEDRTQVIKFDLLDPTARWRNAQNVAASTLYTSEWKRVLAGPATMSIAPVAGCEYQIADDSVGTGAGAWQSGSSTVARNKWVRWRGTTSAAALTASNLGVVLNGQTITAAITTTGPFFTSAGDFGFKDPAAAGSSVGGANGRMVIEQLLYQTANAAATFYQHAVNVTTLDVLGTGAIRLALRDSAGTVLVNNVSSASAAFPAATVNRVVTCFDLPGLKARVWCNDVLVLDLDLAANTGLLAPNGIMNLLQTNAGAGRFAGRCYGMKIWKDQVTDDGTNPVAAPYFSLPGDATTANASSWKNGAGVAT